MFDEISISHDQCVTRMNNCISLRTSKVIISDIYIQVSVKTINKRVENIVGDNAYSHIWWFLSLWRFSSYWRDRLEFLALIHLHASWDNCRIYIHAYVPGSFPAYITSITYRYISAYTTKTLFYVLQWFQHRYHRQIRINALYEINLKSKLRIQNSSHNDFVTYLPECHRYINADTLRIIAQY